MDETKIKKLKELQDLYKTNVLSEAEYTKMKQEILNSDSEPVTSSSSETEQQEMRAQRVPKKSHKTWNIVIGVVALVLICGAAGVGYANLNHKPAIEPATSSKTSRASSSETSSSSSESSASSEVKTENQAKNLSDSQKKQINDEFLNWASDRAQMGNMAVGEWYFDHGAAGRGDWYANTPDGEVQVQDQGTPGKAAFPIHDIGGCVFFTDKNGITGREQIQRSFAENYSMMDQDKPITKYLLGDNGKVYELKLGDGEKTTTTSGFGEYGDDGQHGDYGPKEIFEVSQDKDAQAELQRLIKKYE
ncbi:SHOCT domain-containing protein [Weissella viridescens]|uniref:SHOCT domain-containing protein n=1 Tax=Weissella viridescens TaxID=1629 RepID=UPI004056FBCD